MREQYAGRQVLVTGGDGFIGSTLVELLAQSGASVTALAHYNSFDRAGWLDDLTGEVAAAVRVERGDIRDSRFVDRLVAGHEIVFHLAALISIPYSYVATQSFVETNILGTVNVLEAAKAHGTPRVVHTSTSEVYGTARFTPITEEHALQGQSPYSASKIGADMLVESYARSYRLPAVILRPFNTYGPRQSERAVIPTVIRQALDPDCPAIRLGDLSPKRDFTYVQDTASAFMHIGAAEQIEFGTTYNAGSGTARTVSDVVETIRRLAGTDKPVETEAARIRPPDSEILVLMADSTRLREATGWRPEIPFEEGLGRTIDWWRERLARGAVRMSSAYSV